MKTVFVSGRFNVLHPGHIRLLQFARECGERLIVGIEPDSAIGYDAHVAEHLRLEGVQSCSYVDEAFVMRKPVEEVIGELQPAIVVKGREHELGANVEQRAVATYGGKLVFSSGEVTFTSRDLVRREFASTRPSEWALPQSFMARHGVSVERLRELVQLFSAQKVVVAGDLIIDEYVTCDPIGMSQEDPTLVVKPVDQERFVGGAGIVAAHAAGLGAIPTLISVVGDDAESAYARQTLEKSGVRVEFLLDETRPTTLKTRYRCRGKTLLRVSRLHQAPISSDIRSAFRTSASSIAGAANVLVFSDFNYGVLTQDLVDDLTEVYRRSGAIIAADSQSSSQVGDVGRFRNVDLLTPTEREARISTRNTDDGLVVLAERLRVAAAAKNVFLKLGEEGALICAESGSRQPWPPDRIEALNTSPRDVAGAGDSMLMTSALALAVGGNAWEAACLGSIAAAIQVGRVGNIPISKSEILAVLR